MTDMTSNPPQRSRAGRPRSAEYHLYFFCIFVTPKHPRGRGLLSVSG